MSRAASRVFLLAIAVVLVLPCRAPSDEADSSGNSPLKKVTFTFAPPRQYERVFLAGTFNGWSTDATPMRLSTGRYEVTLPLPVGEYQYKFVADGEWKTDEKAKRFLPDGYGGRNSVVDVDDSFENMGIARGDGEILLDGLVHRADAWERSLDAGGAVTVRVRTWAGDAESVRLVWSGEAWATGSEPGRQRSAHDGDPMERFDTDGTYDYYQLRLASPRFEYAFLITDGDVSAVLDARGPRDGGTVGDDRFAFDASEEAAFRTPDWVKDGIIYQIFPDRFANGDPSNDPDFSEWYYEGIASLPPSGKTNGEYFHLVDDWYDVSGLVASPYKTDGKPDWNSFYGGDIEGVRQNLDYLSDLGVTVIYFNPVFESKSNHKYDAASYTEIDPHFGANGDFTAFVSECHERGIRVVLDLAINHTGHTFWAFVDARENGEESEYWDWYEWNDWPLPGSRVSTPGNALDYYDCWWGFGQMPNLNFDLSRPNSEENTVTDIEDAEPNWPVVNHLLDAAEKWLVEAGVDGYRLDVAGEVPFWFWELFRERVRAVNSDAYIVGELWGASPEWVNGRYFDAVMNYKYFREPVLAFVARGEMDAEAFDRALAPGRLTYADEGVRAMMNLLGSHDTERFLTIAGGDARRLKLAMLFGMTYVGAPCIYYGDEIAMTGSGDPDCRRPFMWDWLERPQSLNVRDHVRALAGIRKRHACLSRGSFQTVLAEGRAFAFERSLGDDLVVVVMNASGSEASVKVPLSADAVTWMTADPGPTGVALATVTNELTGEVSKVDVGAEGGSFAVTLPPMTGGVFSAQVRRIMAHPKDDK
jgi:cyclomaltodextrinase